MAKALVTTPSGINIKIEGTPAEILAVVQDLKRQEKKPGGVKRLRKGATGPPKLVDLIDGLIQDGFFKQARHLAAVKAELEARGDHYPVTTLSGAMLTEVTEAEPEAA